MKIEKCVEKLIFISKCLGITECFIIMVDKSIKKTDNGIFNLPKLITFQLNFSYIGLSKRHFRRFYHMTFTNL